MQGRKIDRVYEALTTVYGKSEPILLNELEKEYGPGIRSYLSRLIKEGRLERYINGVYFLPYTTALGTKGSLLPEDVIERKYLRNNDKVFGYLSGGKNAVMK